MSILLRSFNNASTDVEALGTYVPTSSDAWVALPFSPGDDSIEITYGPFTKSATGTGNVTFVLWRLVTDNTGAQRIVQGPSYNPNSNTLYKEGMGFLSSVLTSSFTVGVLPMKFFNVSPAKFYVTTFTTTGATGFTFTGNVYISSFNSSKLENAGPPVRG